MARPSFESACAQYVHRFTCEYVPAWAHERRTDGTYPAPQFLTDREWCESTVFPGEPGHHGKHKWCIAGKPTWPHGQSLTQPYRRT